MKIARGEFFHPQPFFTVKSLIHFQISYRYKMNIGRTRSIKICLNTDRKALNSNKRSKNCSDAIFNFFENEALSWKDVLVTKVGVSYRFHCNLNYKLIHSNVSFDFQGFLNFSDATGCQKCHKAYVRPQERRDRIEINERLDQVY